MVLSISSANYYDLCGYVENTNSTSTISATSPINYEDIISNVGNTNGLDVDADIANIDIPNTDSVYYFNGTTLMRRYDSLEEYKSARELQVFGVSGFGIGDSTIDYEAEFEEYMKERGCSNTEELQALNSCMYFYNTTSDLKSAAAAMGTFTLLSAMSRGINTNGNLLTAASRIVSNSSISQLSTYMSSCGQDCSSTAKATESLCSSTNFSFLSSVIDKLLEEMKDDGEVSGNYSNYYKQAIKQYQG